MKADLLARDIKNCKYDKLLFTLGHAVLIIGLPVELRDDLVAMLYELNKRRQVMSKGLDKRNLKRQARISKKQVATEVW